MENLESGKEKIRKICDILKNETLKPAKEEAEKMVEVAEQEARNIISDAEAKAEALLREAKAKMAKERELFEHSIALGCRQALELLRQDIEDKLFNKELGSWLARQTADPEIGARLVNVLVQAIEKEGISADFTALVAKQLPSDKINALLLQDVVDHLREKGVVPGTFVGGAQIVLHDKKMTLDLSNEALKELIAPYLRKDFRMLLFQEGSS